MQILPKAGWRYAALLILLFAIAAVAVREILVFMEPPRIPDVTDYRLFAILLSALTFGFMLIASAFGLWAIRFSAEAESVRSVSTIVSTMDYIHDGVIAIDRRGLITAFNPTARHIFGAHIACDQPLRDAFPCLSEADIAAFTRHDEPQEIEREAVLDGQRRMLRFRSQPAHGSSLLLLSDVTAMTTDRIRRRQNAYFQLLGHLARGVANDFNDLLCGISGHASILLRDSALPERLRASARDLDTCAERGLRLAGHLTHLAAAGSQAGLSTTVRDDIEAAASLLANGLDAVWAVHVEAPAKLPPVQLNGSQIEQVIYSLGLLAAEASAGRALWIGVPGPPDDDRLRIFVATEPLQGLVGRDDLQFRTPPADGILDSVVQAILSEAGGTLELAAPVPHQRIYRVALPLAPTMAGVADIDLFPRELEAYMHGWHILAAGSDAALRQQVDVLQRAGIVIDRTRSLSETLATVENNGAGFQVLLIDHSVLGEAPDSLLRMLGRLCPRAGIVVLHPANASLSIADAPTCRHMASDCDASRLRRALLDTRTAAIQHTDPNAA